MTKIQHMSQEVSAGFLRGLNLRYPNSWQGVREANVGFGSPLRGGDIVNVEKRAAKILQLGLCQGKYVALIAYYKDLPQISQIFVQDGTTIPAVCGSEAKSPPFFGPRLVLSNHVKFVETTEIEAEDELALLEVNENLVFLDKGPYCQPFLGTWVEALVFGLENDNGTL